MVIILKVIINLQDIFQLLLIPFYDLLGNWLYLSRFICSMMLVMLDLKQRIGDFLYRQILDNLD
jgi:hypothetical protein